MDFMEVQSVYKSHFESNLSRLGGIDTVTQWLECNYEILQTPAFKQRYNLILCNPPYFFADHGRLSPSEFKNRCRFYLDSDFPNLIRGLANSLTQQGQVFMLLRDLPEHRWQAHRETEQILEQSGSFQLDVLGTIRGTPWVRITALPS
jgi:methylase of polypeptide subunit release factors